MPTSLLPFPSNSQRILLVVLFQFMVSLLRLKSQMCPIGPQCHWPPSLYLFTVLFPRSPTTVKARPPTCHLSRMKFLNFTTSQTYSVALEAGRNIVRFLHPSIQPAEGNEIPEKQNMTSELNIYVSFLSFSKWYNVITIHIASDHLLGMRPDPSSLHANGLPFYIRDSSICSLCFAWVGTLEPSWTATANWTAFSRKCTTSLSLLSRHTRSAWHTKHCVTV